MSTVWVYLATFTISITQHVGLPASINDGTVSDVLQGLQQFALGFVSSVGAWRTAGVGDRDLDATSAIHRGVFVQFTQNGGGADQEVPQCGTHGPGQVWELVCQFSKGLQHECDHSPEFDLNIYFDFRTCSYCILLRYQASLSHTK